VLIERATHVAINRVTGTAEKGKLFTEEIIPVGVKFLGFLISLDDFLLDKVVDMLKVLREKSSNCEVWIGGRGTSGYCTFRLYIPGEVVELRSIILNGLFALKASEPMEVGVCSKPVCKLFPRTLLGSLVLMSEGEASFIIIAESGERFEVKSGEELKRVLDKLKGEGKKYEVKPQGAWSL